MDKRTAKKALTAWPLYLTAMCAQLHLEIDGPCRQRRAATDIWLGRGIVLIEMWGVSELLHRLKS
jgi:hypothetical protein